MIVKVFPLGESDVVNATLLPTAATVLNNIQRQFSFIVGPGVEIPDVSQTAIGTDMGQAIGGLAGSSSAHLTVYMGTMRTAGVSDVSFDYDRGVAAASVHTALTWPGQDISDFSALMHLILYCAVKLAMGGWECKANDCLLGVSDMGWPIWQVPCDGCKRELLDHGLEPVDLYDATVFLGQRRSTENTLMTLQADAFNQSSAPEIEEVIKRLESSIDVLVERFRSRGVSRRDIVEWLHQIGDPKEIELAAKLLHSVTYIDFPVFADMFKEMLDGIYEEEPGAIMVAFGDASDSAGIMQYIGGHSGAGVTTSKSFHEVLETWNPDDEPLTLLLAEDGMFNGDQVTWIFCDYFGIEKPKECRKDKYVDELSPRAKKALKAARVYLLFAVAMEVGVANVKNKLPEMTGLNLVDVRCARMHGDWSKAFHAQSAIWRSREERQAAMNMARRIGMSLLMPSHAIRDFSYLDAYQDSLGFHGLEQLVVYPWSVPKPSLTFLWKSGGNYGQRPWRPLFPLLRE